ncbi:ABC transporter permease [Psychrobacillus sp. FSL K6-2684]|uniref:ABC transporter permease n=1 Tax=unclassified Psychrobacillus TaxID=2636677 RepID=UPI0012477478|nr:ABC transporter permease [Psychrobacillus sp. AK 1817]QEY21149.1 ABC transporter permease [Psychrobacillus sp. AK 1817]
MMAFMMKQLIRNKDRLILSVIGVVLISSVLIYLFSLTETTKGTVNNQLQQKWESAYDLVVIPPGTIFSEENLMEPNYLNGINGGISYDQYEAIRSMNDIAVAAPVSVLGYTTLGITMKEKFKTTDNSIYKYKIVETFNDGLSQKTIQDTEIYGVTNWRDSNEGLGFFAGHQGQISLAQYQLLVGIDPVEEAKLVGLDKSVQISDTSRYLDPTDEAIYDEAVDRLYEIPVLINNKSFSNSLFQVSQEKLAIPFNTEAERQQATELIKKGNGRDYLNGVQTEKVDSFELTGKELESMIFKALANPNDNPSLSVHGTQLIFKSSIIDYQKIESPFPERWAYSYQVSSKPIEMIDIFKNDLPDSGLRKAELLDHELTEDGVPLLPVLRLNIVGSFSSDKLNISKDPITELPLETYRPTEAEIVLGPDHEPLNPPRMLKGSGLPTGLLTNPPNILTTVKAAEVITGGNSISSIRIKIKGIDDIGNAAQEKMEQVKNKIEHSTGLQVIITRGSSPQPTITQVVEHDKALGWIEQPWIHIGAAITLLRETSLGYTSILVTILLIGSMYVFATTFVSYLTRKKEYSIFLAIGWRTGILRKMLLGEAFFYVIIITLIAFILEVSFMLNGGTFNFSKIALVFSTSLVIYGLGIILPLIQVGRLKPYQGITSGEITQKSKRIFSNQSMVGFVLNQVSQRPGRNLLSVLAIALPSTLLSFYLYVSFRLEGVLYTSWLGEFVAVEVNKSHYLIMGAALIIGALTTAEMMWQNIVEREGELALFKSIGWKDMTVTRSIFFEGALVGLLAGVVGLILSISYIGIMYKVFPWDSLLILSLTICVPVIVGILGACFPAIKALRTNPYNVLKENV